MDDPLKCSYCNLIIDSDDFLNCEKCKSNVHTKCLKRPGTPGDLLGDVFFTFTCCNCSTNNREIFRRQRLPWLMIIIIAIYNLSIQSKGLSHHGYFHWRTHIVNFIDKNWEYLFPISIRRKKKWVGTVSGILSHHSPEFFISGQGSFKESGWWTLTYNQTPKFYFKLYEQLTLTRQNLRNDKRTIEENNSNSDYSSSTSDNNYKRRKLIIAENEIFSRTLPYMGREPKIIIKKQPKEKNKLSKKNHKNVVEMNSVQSDLKEFLEESLAPNDLLFDDITNAFENEKVLSLIGDGNDGKVVDIYDLWNTDLPPLDFGEYRQQEHQSQIEQNHTYTADKTVPYYTMSHSIETTKPYDVYQLKEIKQENDSSDNDNNENNDNDNENYDNDNDDNDNDCKDGIVKITDFQQIIKNEIESQSDDEDDDNSSENDNDEEIVYEESLFTKNTPRTLTWEEEDEQMRKEDNGEDNVYDDDNVVDNNEYNNGIEMMSTYEEESLYKNLRKIFNNEKRLNLNIPSKIRRFYRKLCIRRYKRNKLIPLFNLDTEKCTIFNYENKKSNVLDRYCEMNIYNDWNRYQPRLSGPIHYEFFESPYTSRILHPFIYRHSKLFPPWLKVICELQYTATGNYPSRSTIDFCYVRPNHIPAVNALLQNLFWPGIDVSECLSYPDFSVIALYKKLIIGCGFLVPDVGHNEAYISFMAVHPNWQRSGIATFMLYHLTQTCMTKDITLHVSATNPAVCLYQKFGFKIKEVILDFYEKYLPIDSNHSRHALFLRLAR